MPAGAGSTTYENWGLACTRHACYHARIPLPSGWYHVGALTLQKNLSRHGAAALTVPARPFPGRRSTQRKLGVLARARNGTRTDDG
jgi:hypothetical protein